MTISYLLKIVNKYQERIEIEFPNYPREKIDLLDSYIEHKRWLKVQSKALFRDWEREKLELKNRTVKSIESEIKETEERISKELEAIKQEALVSKLHKNRDENRIEYEAKLKVIKEIEEEKKLELKLEEERKEIEYRNHCKEIKEVAKEYGIGKQDEIDKKIKEDREREKQKEEEIKQQLEANRPKVEKIREKEELKVKEKYEKIEKK